MGTFVKSLQNAHKRSLLLYVNENTSCKRGVQTVDKVTRTTMHRNT